MYLGKDIVGFHLYGTTLTLLVGWMVHLVRNLNYVMVSTLCFACPVLPGFFGLNDLNWLYICMYEPHSMFTLRKAQLYASFSTLEATECMYIVLMLSRAKFFGVKDFDAVIPKVNIEP